MVINLKAPVAASILWDPIISGSFEVFWELRKRLFIQGMGSNDYYLKRTREQDFNLGNLRILKNLEIWKLNWEALTIFLRILASWGLSPPKMFVRYSVPYKSI